MLELNAYKGWEQSSYFTSAHSSDSCRFIYLISTALVTFCAYKNVNQTNEK